MSQPPRRAAQYVRMSTEHQRYSITAQSTANAEYAAEHGLQIVRTYTDAGISGLGLKRRAALQRLLADVVGGSQGFDVVLVYDVSRWGRFQDADESAHYEFLCREAGVRVLYTAEAFANDGSLGATLVKQLKRAMAAEYSRELSVKVARAQRGLARMGYWAGGPPGYGFRRQVVTPLGELGAVLEPHAWKGSPGWRTIIVPGPPEEVATVRWIFEAFGIEKWATNDIAATLNEAGRKTSTGGPWSRDSVRRVLADEKCIGVLLVGQRVTTLKQTRRVPKDQWVRIEHACVPLVEREVWKLAQARRRRAKPSVADDVLLAELRDLLARKGRLSDDLIRRDPKTHASAVYARRFGGLMGAYALVGYRPSGKQARAAARARVHRPHIYRRQLVQPSDEALIAAARKVLDSHGRLSSLLLDASPTTPAASYYRRRFGSLRRVYDLLGYAPAPNQLLRLQEADLRRQPSELSISSWSASAGEDIGPNL